MSNNNNWKRVGGFSRTGTQNYVRTNDAAMGGTIFGSTDVSYNTGNSTLRIGNNAGVVFINGDIDMSGGPGVGAPINRVRNVRDPIADQDVATKFYVDKEILLITSRGSGDKGDTGEQGPPGVGFAGQNGSDGPTGATGCTGTIGPPGPVVGVKGPTGDSGAKGATGANGAAGATGPIGPIGEKGTQGTQGTQGIQGSNGTILWLNPDGDSQVNQLITDSYMLSTVPIISSMRTIGPISVSATYGNSNKMIPGTRFWNTAKKVSTLAVIPSGVWALNLYANVPSNSDANQVSLYAAVFMISGTSNQPSAASLIIETKDGGDAGFYPPRAAYLPDHVKYIGKSWTPTDNILTDTTANLGAVIDSTTRKLYKIEMPVEFTTLKDASGNTENVYVQLQIYIKNTMAAKQTGNINLFYQTDADTNATTYSYLQTTFGAVGIEGSQGTTGPIGLQGTAGATGPAGTVGATGAVGPTGTTGSRGPEGPKGPTGPTGPAGQSNSVGRQYTVQYRSNPPISDPNNDADVSGSFAGNANFRYIPDGSTINASTATTGTLVLNDIACRSIHSSFYVEDPSITGSSIRPRTFVKGGELVLGSGGGYIVLASGKNASASGPFSPATAADITHGIKLVHNIEETPPTATFNLHHNSNAPSSVGIKFDLTNGNVIAARDQFCVVNQTGAVGVGGMTPSEMTAESGLNRRLHVRGNIMVGTHPGAGTEATSAMILLNKATTTPGATFSTYPGVYHRSIANTAEAATVGGIATGTAGLGLISPNFITFQTGTSFGSNSIVINQAGDVSVTGRANLNGAVSVGKNFVAVTEHDSNSPNMDVSGILHISSGAINYTDKPRMKLTSNVIAPTSDIPLLSATSTANEIRGVCYSGGGGGNSGFLRLSAQTPANSCIDMIGYNTSPAAAGLSNSVRISTAGAPRMVINGSGNVGIGTTEPTVALDVSGIANVSNYLSVGSGGSSSGATTSILPDKFYVRSRSNWRDYIPLLVADTTTDIIIWGDPDRQWYDVTYAEHNEIAKQYSYFAGYWLNANRAVVEGTPFSVESFAGSPPTTRGIFTFTATAASNGIVTGYKATLSLGNFGPQVLTPQQDGINAGVARRSLSNRTLIMGGSVETGYLGVVGVAKVSTILSAQTGLILGDNTRSAMDLNVDSRTGCLLNIIDTSPSGAAPRMRFIANENSVDIGCHNTETYIWSRGDTNLVIATNGTQRMTITKTGNVGIGIQAPSSLLHVAGTAHVAGAAKITGNLDMSLSGKIVNLVTPTAAEDAATKGYVDGRFVNASISTATIGSTSDGSVVDNSVESKLAIYHATAPKIYISTSSSAEYGLLIGKDPARAYIDNREPTGELAIVTEQNIPIVFKTNVAHVDGGWGINRMVITPEGLVGIGTSNPNAPLHVGTTKSIPTGYTAFYSFAANSGTWTARWSGGGNYNVSIISGGDLWVKGNYIWVSSDKRIKRNIRDIEGTTALSQVRKIRPKLYNYIDNTKGTQDIYGFIAQDTEDVITSSSMIMKDYIPNFYCKGDIATIDQTNHIYEISTQNEFKFEKVLDASGNEITNYKIKLYDEKNKEYICTVIHRIDANTIRVKCDKEYVYSTIEEYKNAVFIYGQEVNDFYNLDKNAIFTVATAALQEVDRQQQADKARIAELENQVSNLEATVGSLESTVASQQSLINDILERLKKLEA